MLCPFSGRKGRAFFYCWGIKKFFVSPLIANVAPATTYALCNEVSDHLPIYMWGRVARRYLTLPNRGYHIATSVHADTIDDVIQMYQHNLRVSVEDIRRLGLVVNIGIVGRVYPLRRRWLTTHFLQPQADPKCPDTVIPLPLSLWNDFDDTFEHAKQPILNELANWAGMSPAEFAVAFQLRIECLEKLSHGQGADM